MIWVEGNSLLICFDAGNRRSLEPQEGLSSLRRRCNKKPVKLERITAAGLSKVWNNRVVEKRWCIMTQRNTAFQGSNLSKCRQLWLCLLGSWSCRSRCHLHKIHRCPERTSDRLSDVYWSRGIHLDWHSYFSSFKLNMLLVYNYTHDLHSTKKYI